jgi:hypothetical protein
MTKIRALALVVFTALLVTLAIAEPMHETDRGIFYFILFKYTRPSSHILLRGFSGNLHLFSALTWSFSPIKSAKLHLVLAPEIIDSLLLLK